MKNLGTIGAPLRTRDAEALKSKAEQSPTGKRKRAAVDQNMRGPWKLDAKLVRFATVVIQSFETHWDQITSENPQWATFMKKTVEQKTGNGYDEPSTMHSS